MLILGTTTDKIQVTLSSAITTNQLDCIATYKDITTSAYSGSAPILVTTNNTTNVDLVPAPGSNTQRIVDFISIYNNDTANATVIVTINRNGSIGILFKCTLKTSESLVYSEGAGWNIHSNNGSPKQFLSYDTSLNSNKNYFKNPAFSVIQSSASGTLANSLALPTASLGYLGETEWCIAASGGTPAYAFNSANESVTFTGAASTTAIYLLQRLESRDTNRLKAKTVTFSCEISNSLLTSVIWEVFRPTTSNDTHGTIATPTQTLIASGTFTVSSTLTRYSATFTLPDLVSRGLEVRLRVGAQTSGTWVVARLQLEEGSLATNFNCDDFGEELRKCQRHYQKQAPQGISPVATFTSGGIGTNAYIIGSGGSTSPIVAIPLLMPMFAVPSMVFSDATGATGVVTAFIGGSWFNGQGVTLYASSDTSISIGSGTSTYIYCRYQTSAHIP